ncbi:MAG TPA: glycoside hydrolase family 3 N-terminal domain-containing protein [Candidatus Limnocylindrales bacterium]|nr:glycoside hydrolase family 3 N-terminal domain-containing protein [Candidatus Limnocylindrales bacterium]
MPARRTRILALLVAMAVAVWGPAAAMASAADTPTLAQLIGQKLVIAMSGTTPTSSLLGRVKRGEVGGIVLFKCCNITTQTRLLATVRKLQAAARDGGQPPLLIMADQEGGTIRTIPWAPTKYSAKQMGANGDTAFVRGKGQATGRGLLASGVNVDLAPVADVAYGTSGFMYLAGRTFSTSSAKVSRLACAFAAGLADRHVVATLKHFPGIGRVKLNTDRYVQTVTASRSALASDLAPFQAGIDQGVPMIMLSNATYTAYDSAHAAGWSKAIATTLLRGTMGFTGVSITDSLSGTAAARGVSAAGLAYRAAKAGTDMVMITSSEAYTSRAFTYLLGKATDGYLSRATLEASYARILALKSTVAVGP